MADVHEAFQTHKLTRAGFEKAIQIAERFNDLLSDLTALVPEGRELAIVKTKLEEACFFAKKGMAKKNCEG